MKRAKKGGGKGGGKTEEERLLLLQQRAQAEEEMTRKKEEILTLFLKDKLQKEERNTAVNLLKICESWRSILRQSRAAEGHRDSVVHSQTHERRLDLVVSVVENLEHDLQQAERQLAQARRVHQQHQERLVAQHHKQQECFVQQQWDDCLQHLSSMFSSEREQKSSLSQQLGDKQEHVKTTVRQQHQTEMNEILKLLAENTPADKRTALEEEEADMIQENTDRPEEETPQNQEAVQLCSVEAEKLGRSQQKKKLKEDVVRPRARLNSSMRENELVEQDLMADIRQVNRWTHELRDRLTEARVAARKQLTELTVQSNEAAKKLQAVLAKGGKVSRVVAMCHKLEKNVLVSLPPPEEVRQERSGLAIDEPVQEISELQQVMRSINTSVLQREAQRKQKRDLMQENQQLRILLRQHLDAMMVSDSDINTPHALLNVYRAPATTAPHVTDRRHNVIEAVYVVQHSL
uniref:dynein regulatory complex subunit 2 n=1 Tax=Epinephelus lanceolatus TaxID=310571 RepID=UPI001444CCE6|nr:dynein regulatory complex subunit 2 [Epinephelus lanceolatus]